MPNWNKIQTFWQIKMVFSLLKKNMELLKKLQIVVTLGRVIIFLITLLLTKSSILPRFVWYLTPLPRDLNECLYRDSTDSFNFWYFPSLLKILDCHDVRHWKTFLKVSVDKGDRDYQRFLWFNNVFSEVSRIVRNRFARVIFGVISFFAKQHD